MRRKTASKEANGKIKEANEQQIWSATCRWCGEPVRGTMEHMREVGKKHGLGRCKEIKNGV